ncbi:NusG domain II-containing protein [Sporofaciens sp. SGI.106]|uniref:NusG domain II-containing protein n=1 Tax=Sporofaciens sp. SGI.106 TaxID=3420568 RepID=UPI002A9BC945|nr:NusG domain II-containing protein [Lachnoclostridium sp.]
MKIRLKKKDWILIVVIIFVSAGSYFLHQSFQHMGRGCVVIKVNGVIEGTYNLNEDQEISINGGSNILKIQNGKASMIEADCPDKLCVHQRPISRNHENIICLPNKVIVEAESMSDSTLDAMTN